MPTIKQLSQRHPSYDQERCLDLEALYEGDVDGLFGQRLKRFLPQRQAEPVERYKLRCREAHYRNYLGAIIDFFAALLLTSKPRPVAMREGSDSAENNPGDYYSTFREDCDRSGSDIDEFFKDRLIDAMVHRISWWSVEQPVGQEAVAETRSDFEKLGLGDCWLRPLEHCDVLDWDLDDAGNLAWVLVHSKEARRANLADGRGRITERWEHYLPDRIDVYEITYDKSKGKPNPEADVPLIDSRSHTIGSVPIRFLELPTALWVANRLKSPQLAQFRVSNAGTWGLSQTCYAMPVFKLKDRKSMPLMGAGYGIVIGAEEEIGWASPPSTPFEALDTEDKKNKDEIFRLAHQMALGVENNAAAVGRSAESKLQDSQSTRVIMLAFARRLKEAVEGTYDLIEKARQDGFKWSVDGLDEFSSADLLGLIEALGRIRNEVGEIPSRTFRVEAMQRLADAVLPDIDEAKKTDIRREIQDGTTDPSDDRRAEIEAAGRLFGSAEGAERSGEDPVQSATGTPGNRRRSAPGQVNARRQATA